MPKGGDCMECKVIGVTTFSGIAAYANVMRISSPRTEKGNRIFLGCFAICAAGLAIARAIY
jgi:hypothetical protein